LLYKYCHEFTVVDSFNIVESLLIGGDIIKSVNKFNEAIIMKKIKPIRRYFKENSSNNNNNNNPSFLTIHEGVAIFYSLILNKSKEIGWNLMRPANWSQNISNILLSMPRSQISSRNRRWVIFIV
jgi:hypothetical protein